ncbi:MAG: glycosyltransferase, partial [Candidatus Falkowbacteria bacterium]|nr:glycosyltransferase [Candidatus Falkowbacteria bacterium]
MIVGVDARVLMDKNYSGVSEYAASLLAALLEIDSDNEYRLFYNSWHNLSARFKIWERPNVKIIKTSYPNKIFNYVLQKIFKYPKLDQVINGCDLFFSPHLNFSELSSATKKILVVHDLSFLRYPEFFSARKNIWHKALAVKSLIGVYDIIVAVSESTKSDLIELIGLDPEKIKVIYSGIDRPNLNINLAAADQFLKIKNIKTPYILYLGNLEPRKNIDGLI